MRSILPGSVAPDFEATTLDGKPFNLSDLRGKVVLVDFWATWCGPCVAEIPNVKSLYEKFGQEHFAVVGISFDSDAGTARKFVSDRQLPWTQIWAKGADEGPIATRYGVGGIPATFLIGPDGKLIERDLHGDELATNVAREVRKLSGGAAPPDNVIASAVSNIFGRIKKALPPPLPAESPEARAVLDATLAHYHQLKSYRDRFTARARLEQTEEPRLREGRLEGTLAWAGNRIASTSDLLHVYADGHKVTRYWPAANQYMRQDQPADLVQAVLSQGDWTPFGPDAPGLHPLATILATDDAAKTPILVVTGVEPATRNNQSGRTLRGCYRMDGLSQGRALPFAAFIDDASQLFAEFRLDYTEAYRTALRESYAGDPDAVKQAEIVISFDDIQTNGSIEDAAFTLDAPAAREFNPFGGMRIDQPAPPEELISRTAPALAGVTLDGARFDLAEHRGDFAVVAFWATWAPQAEDVLRELQDLATALPANVHFVGVSRNGPAGAAAARDVIARSHAAFPQVGDVDGTLGESWNVTLLPLIYVVGPDGRVREMYSTWSDQTRQALADSVAAAASAEPAALTGAVTTPSAGGAGGGLTLTAAAAPLTDSRVSVGETDHISASRWNMSEQDIDNDGALELVFPDWQGGITVLETDSGEIDRIPLPGMSGGMQNVRGVRMDGETCWLCTSSRFGYPGGGAARPLVYFYSPRGELLWKFEAELPAGRDAQAQAVGGDFDGDGHIEFVIGLSTYTREETGENQYTLTDMRGRLIWLDHRGQRIADHDLEHQVDLLYAAPATRGKPATVLCIGGGQLGRYTLAPEPHQE
ncbi:MAG TPA: TlpA disulfide reductase family protein [Phycisphaerae bacterium]|nr:TlpA disulfide reductase family protein [Phycisphaerae bacterium]